MSEAAAPGFKVGDLALYPGDCGLRGAAASRRLPAGHDEPDPVWLRAKRTGGRVGAQAPRS